MQFPLKLFQTFILRDVFRNLTRSLITVLGIALGISVVLSINLANHSALTRFRESIDLVAGKANLEIRPISSATIDIGLLKQLVPLVGTDTKFTPVIRDVALFPSTTDEFVQLLGVDTLADPEFTSYAQLDKSIVQKNQEETSLLDEDPSQTVLVGQKLATRHNLDVGSDFDLIVNDKLRQFKVTGVLSGEGIGGAYSGDLVIVDIETAQAALGTPDRISQIEMIVPPDKLSKVRADLKQHLPPNVEVASPDQHGKQLEKMTASFEANLNSMSFISLMVGLLLIYNTMTISVIRRRRELGTLRAIGASRRNIFCLFGLEALTFGVVGSAIGVLLGSWLGTWALKAVAATMQYFYFQLPMDQVTLDWNVVAFAFLAGVASTLLISLLPILEATLVEPAEATRRASHDVKIHGLARSLALSALPLLLVAALCALIPSTGYVPVFAYAGTALAMLSGLLLSPLLLQNILLWSAGPLSKLLGAEGKIAARTLYGALGRTVIGVASLMVGIAMMVCMTVMITSFRTTVVAWLDQTFKADLWMEPVLASRGSKTARMDAALVESVRRMPQVLAVEPFLTVPMQYKGQQVLLAAADLSTRCKYGNLIFPSGESASSVCSRVGDTGAIVSESFAYKQNIKQGDEISLPTADGQLRLKVEGIYSNYTSDLGYIVVPQSMYAKKFHDHSVSACAIYLRPNTDANAVRLNIFKLINSKQPLHIQTNRELHAESIKIFDKTFAVVYALDAIAIIISLLVIVNTLFALTFEARRDFGILRYVGGSREQLKKIVMVQAGLLGSLGTIWGLALGLALALVLIHVLNRQSFGWTVQLSIPHLLLLQSSLAIVTSALLAGIIPAAMAAKTLAPDVVRDE